MFICIYIYMETIYIYVYIYGDIYICKINVVFFLPFA